ncbi:MAG: ABC transporter substrate-binding protein [Sulfuricellaceae bacterium]
MKHFFSRLILSAIALARGCGYRCTATRKPDGEAFRLIFQTACVALWLLTIVGGLTGCTPPSAEAKRAARHDLATKNYQEGNDISLAVVWNTANGEFFSGAQLAAEEINAEGGVEGRRIRLDFIDEAPFLQHKSVERSRAEGRYRNARQEAGVNIARAAAANPNVTAVIGHTNSAETTFPAMLTYQDNGILFLSGGTTDSRIMWSGKNLFFQLRPQDEVLAKKMAVEMKKRRWDTIYLVYEDTGHNEHLVELLKAECANSGIRFAGSLSIMPDLEDDSAGAYRIQNSMANLRDDDVNAIVLLTQPAQGAEIMRQSRTLGVLQPFIGTDALDSPAFVRKVGDSGVDVLITSLYHTNSYLVRRFVESFQKRFPDAVVDEAALIGYDSVRLYAEGVASADATDPHLVANALHYKLPIWYGLLGSYSFKDAHTLNLKYSIRQLVRNKKGRLEFISVDDSF